jgi:hypothetical protein
MGIEFKYSNGWLQRFKQRHNLASLTIKGEPSSVDVQTAEKWHKNLAPIPKQYASHNIFNVDETLLFY